MQHPSLAAAYNAVTAGLAAFSPRPSAALEAGRRAALFNALARHDRDTAQHSFRVSHYAYLLAKSAGAGEDKARKVNAAALLHDVGKLGIDPELLTKPGRFTDEEYAIMKRHTALGALIILQTLKTHFALIAAQGALLHHERLNGTGYHGITDLPEIAKTLAICDYFDAGTTDRPGSPARPPRQVFAEMERQQDGDSPAYDPALLAAFKAIAPGAYSRIDTVRAQNGSSAPVHDLAACA